MSIIPIHTKITKERWLRTNLRYSKSTNKELLDNLYTYIIKWINNQEEIHYIGDNDKDEFINYIFEHYIKPIHPIQIDYDEMYEYYDMKYNSEIIDLFLELKNITRSYNSLLFHDSDSYYLKNYIYTVCTLDDPYNDSEYSDNETDLDINEKPE